METFVYIPGYGDNFKLNIPGYGDIFLYTCLWGLFYIPICVDIFKYTRLWGHLHIIYGDNFN